MENIRMISEKQLALLNKLINPKKGMMENLVEFKRLTQEQLSKLTMSAASDIISHELDFVRNIAYYTEVDCYELDALYHAYARMLELDYEYVPKCTMKSIEYHDGTHVLGMWQNGYCDYEITFRFEGGFDVSLLTKHTVIIAIKTVQRGEDGDVVNESYTDLTDEVPSVDEFATPDPCENEGNEDWYREGTGQYYEDRAEAGMY